MLRPATLVAAALLSAASAAAQAPGFLEVSLSGIRNSPFPTIQGDHRRDFFFATIRRGWTLESGPTSLIWIVDLIPVALSTNNTWRYDTLPCGGGCSVRVPRGRTALGAGLAPLGVQLAHRASHAVVLTVEGTGGAILFDENFPDPNARRMNFSLGAAVGASIDVGHRSAVSLSVVRHHLSNAGTAQANPGVNAWMFRLGFVTRRGRT